MSHRLVVLSANVLALIVLLSALFGFNVHLDDIFGVSRTLREVSTAAWALLVPAWFTIEDQWAPTEEEKLKEFRHAQQTGRIIWATVGALVFTVVLAAPNAGNSPANAKPPIAADNSPPKP